MLFKVAPPNGDYIPLESYKFISPFDHCSVSSTCLLSEILAHTAEEIISVFESVIESFCYLLPRI